MIIYFADKNLNITCQASTTLPYGFRILDDLTTEEIDSGVNTFSCRIAYDEGTRAELESGVQVGDYLLKSSGYSQDDSESTYDSLYQVVETEFDTKEQELYIYAEDAGLDLINKVVEPATLTGDIEYMLECFVPNDWEINLINTPTTIKTYTWDGENTATERIKSIAGIFDCEVYYSFNIDRFEVYEKVVNIVAKRGTQEATAQLRLNLDINQIVTKSSIANLATAFSVTGGTPEGSETPINLKGYSYHYHDVETDDYYEVDTTTGQMRNVSAMERWASEIDTDGLIVKTYTFDTVDKATLAGQARAELQKVCNPEVNYDVDFIELPNGTQVGDRIIIIDEDGELYLEARILVLETSVCNNTQKATIGEYLLRDSGIVDKVRAMADEFASQGKALSGTTISIASSGGNVFHNMAISTELTATVFYGAEAITTNAKLKEIYGDTAILKWYDSSERVAYTGFGPHSVSSPNDVAKYIVRLEV